MKNIVVVGSQWGDEGKGKIVDWLSDQADIVIRFQGGHNAGHTLVIDGVTYKLRLLPSGIVRKDKISIIGNGVVVDPWALLDEIKEIQSKGITINEDNLMISECANLILPFHKEIDEIREKAAEHFHTTNIQAMKIADESQVKRLILTHFSSRLSDKDIQEWIWKGKPCVIFDERQKI